MNELRVLLQKEWRENVRNYKILWIPIFFIFFGLVEPLSNYYLPQILERFGGLPEGMDLMIPEVTGNEIIISLTSQYQLMGVLVIVLAFMGSIAGERKSGTATLLYVRPMSYTQYFISKWLIVNALVVASVWIGYLVCWYYTNQLFDPVEAVPFFAYVTSYSLWIIFVVTIVLVLSASVSTVVAATIGLILTVIYPIFDSMLAIVKITPFKLSNYAANWFYPYAEMGNFWWSTALTVGIIGVLIVFGSWMAKKNASKTTV